jgi:hypothetical protein
LQGTQVVFSKLGAEAAFAYMTAVFKFVIGALLICRQVLMHRQ